MRRLVLVRQASTPGMRSACFPSGEHADRAALAMISSGILRSLPGGHELHAAPEPAARETAEAIGPAHVVVPALAEADHGRWRGLPYGVVAGAEPDAVLRWQQDPEAAPHGGESLAAMARRVTGWLAGQAELTGTAVACCDAGPIRVALCHALGLDLSSGALFDIAPLSVTELRAARGGWRIGRVNQAQKGFT